MNDLRLKTAGDLLELDKDYSELLNTQKSKIEQLQSWQSSKNDLLEKIDRLELDKDYGALLKAQRIKIDQLQSWQTLTTDTLAKIDIDQNSVLDKLKVTGKLTRDISDLRSMQLVLSKNLERLENEQKKE